jgi:hypothetical protein
MRDDGSGFDGGSVPPEDPGLDILRECAKAHRATLIIDA